MEPRNTHEKRCETHEIPKRNIFGPTKAPRHGGTKSTRRTMTRDPRNLAHSFNYNQMKGNEDKCHVMLSSQGSVHVNISTVQTENSKYSKLLGINIDSKLTFEGHINRTCKTSSTKLNALSKISYYMDPLKRRLLVNAFFTSQFNYCPLTWMFHSRKWNNKINRLHERFIRLIYSDRIFSYEELLDKDNSVPIHQNNLQKLTIEMFKTYTGLASQVMN